jgi:hypothetical protein
MEGRHVGLDFYDLLIEASFIIHCLGGQTYNPFLAGLLAREGGFSAK